MPNFVPVKFLSSVDSVVVGYEGRGGEERGTMVSFLQNRKFVLAKLNNYK
jgi:hypothetical protein